MSDVVALASQLMASSQKVYNLELEIERLRARVAELEAAICVVASDRDYSALWVPDSRAVLSWEGRLGGARSVEVSLTQDLEDVEE